MRTCEWVVVAYAVYLLITAAIVRTPGRRARRVAVLQSGSVLLIGITAWFEPARAADILRDWLPGWYLLAGYWASGLVYRGPNEPFESRLEAIDAKVFTWLAPVLRRAPRLLFEFLEACYLLCYPVVPGALAVLYLTGHRASADAFWTVVLVSALGVYGFLPWLGTRPPRALARDRWLDRRPVAVRRFNLTVLHHASIQVNTFPSGHAAAATAVALMMWSIGPAWPVFAVFATGIGLGAAIGRYHYWADVIAGALLALVVFALMP